MMKERKSGEGPKIWVTDEHVQGLRIHSQHHKDEQEQEKEEGKKEKIGGRKGVRREGKEKKKKNEVSYINSREIKIVRHKII